jgi:hypothetical protein
MSPQVWPSKADKIWLLWCGTTVCLQHPQIVADSLVGCFLQMPICPELPTDVLRNICALCDVSTKMVRLHPLSVCSVQTPWLQAHKLFKASAADILVA